MQEKSSASLPSTACFSCALPRRWRSLVPRCRRGSRSRRLTTIPGTMCSLVELPRPRRTPSPSPSAWSIASPSVSTLLPPPWAMPQSSPLSASRFPATSNAALRPRASRSFVTACSHAFFGRLIRFNPAETFFCDSICDIDQSKPAQKKGERHEPAEHRLRTPFRGAA